MSMPKNMRATLSYGEGGYYVEWYRWAKHEDDGEVTRWWGTRQECAEMGMGPPPRGCKWHKTWADGKSSLERHETYADCH